MMQRRRSGSVSLTPHPPTPLNKQTNKQTHPSPPAHPQAPVRPQGFTVFAERKILGALEGELARQASGERPRPAGCWWACSTGQWRPYAARPLYRWARPVLHVADAVAVPPDYCSLSAPPIHAGITAIVGMEALRDSVAVLGEDSPLTALLPPLDGQWAHQGS